MAQEVQANNESWLTTLGKFPWVKAIFSGAKIHSTYKSVENASNAFTQIDSAIKDISDISGNFASIDSQIDAVIGCLEGHGIGDMMNEYSLSYSQKLKRGFTQYFSSNTTTTVAIGTECSDQLRNLSSLIYDEHQKTQKVADTLKKTKKLFIDKLKLQKQQIANNTIRSGAIFSAVILAAEIYSLINAWNQISKSKSIIIPKEKREEILSNMNKLDQMLNQMQIYVRDNNKPRKLNITYNKACRLCNNTKNSIVKLQANLNGKQIALSNLTKQQWGSAVSNAAQCGSHLYQAIQFWEHLNDTSKLISKGIVGAFGLLTIGNVACAVMSNEEAKRIGKLLQEVNQWEIRINNIQTAIEQCERVMEELEGE